MTHVVSPFYVPVPVKLYDAHADPIEASQVRDLRTNQPYRLVGSVFEGTTLDTSFWTGTATTTAATVTQVSGAVTIASGTANSGFSQLQSVRKARFIFAHPHISRFALRIPTVVVALNTRRWGAFSTTSAPTPTDGFWFELSAAGVLSVNTRNAGGTINSVASGSFNGEGGPSYTLDTNVHAFEIHYYVMGVEWLIDQIRIHTTVPTTANLSSLYTLPATVNSENGASGVTSGTIEVWATNIVREGRDQTAPITYTFANGQTAGVTLKRGPGELHAMSLGQATNNATIIVYDNTTAAAPVLATWVVPNNSIIPVNMTDLNMPFYTGLTLAVTTQNAGLTLVYE